jgi:hypothetical protein
MFGKMEGERKERKMREGKRTDRREGKYLLSHVVWLVGKGGRK